MSIIIKPIITEKATKDSELRGRYAFLVDPKSNKIEIKKAVEAAYGVTVKQVRTMIYLPKYKTRYTKAGVQQGKTNKTKKAVVELTEGQFIDIYANI